jgi:hypothetical protein
MQLFFQRKIQLLIRKSDMIKVEEIELGFLLRHGLWNFIYRLMPCFVASYIDLCKDESVAAAAKDFYSMFISLMLENFTQLRGVICSGTTTNSYLKWKFDCVASELKIRLYGAGAESPTVVRQMQEKCFDVLTDFLGREDETTGISLNLQWRSMLYDFSDRMQHSLLKAGLPLALSEHRVDKDIEYALSTLCRNLAEDIFKHLGYKDNQKLSNSCQLLSAIFIAHAKSGNVQINQLRSNASNCTTWADVQSIIETECEKLSEQQRFGIALYLCLTSNDMTACVSRHRETTFFSFPDNDWMEALLTQLLCGYFATAAEKIPIILIPSLSQVSLEFAQETAPTCYTPILNRVQNGKVTMDAPGQNTFCPVPHCRWCGLVQEPSAMRVCHDCTDSPRYPDTHLFCSSECEDHAMKDKHGKRHAEFNRYKQGLEKVNRMFPQPLEHPNYIMYKTSLRE